MGKITLACGVSASERSAYLDRLWRDHIDETLLLAPTNRFAQTRQEAFIRRHGLPGLWGRRAWELGAFTRTLLESSGRRVAMVSALDRRLMVRRALEDVLRRPSAPPIECAPGVVRHLLRVITLLKQAAVEPAQFRALVERRAQHAHASSEPTSVAAFDALVADVYDGYQTALITREFHDVPGLYWEADEACRAGRIQLPGQASMLLLDGFDDFTPSEQRFLVTLSQHVARMVIGLNYDVDPGRSDLFQLQERCVEALRRQTQVELLTFSTITPATRAQFAAQHLFWRNPPPRPEDLAGTLQIMACADVHHEIEAIGRRVKKLLVRDAVPPEAVAVALADIEQWAGALHDVFEEFGIPHAMRQGPPLLNTATGAFIMRLFEVFRDWEAHAVAALIASPFIKVAPEEQEALMAMAVIARHAGVIAGRDAWAPALDRLERRLQQEDRLPHAERLPIPHPHEALTLFKKRLDMLVAAADALAACVTLRDHAVCLDQQLHAFNMDAAAGATAPASEMNAVQALRALLEALADADQADEKTDGATFAQLLRDGMQETQVPLESAHGPGVVCVNVDGLRHESFEQLFLGGLNEGTLPGAAAVNAVYSESDIRRLRGMGLDLRGRHEHTFRERLRFYHALCAAAPNITLSWRKLDASGRDALPSPFVVDLGELFEGAPEIVMPEPGPDCFVADADAVASGRDLAAAVFHHGYAGLDASFPALLPPIRARAAVETRRNSDQPFDVYDGVIEAPDLQAWLAQRYGDAAQFSVSQLERYNAFPFHFFIEQLLRLRETRAPEGELEPMTRGIVMHDALQRFHEQYRGLSVNAILEADEGAARAFIEECAAEAFNRHAWRMTSVPDVVRRVEERRLVLVLNRYLTRENERDAGAFKPQAFETAFGRAPRENQDALSRPEPFVLDIDGRPYRFAGKIDRIDLNDDQVRIIDYKASSTPTRTVIMQGLDLQLTVYSWAVERHLMSGQRCAEAWYLPVYKGRPMEALTVDKADKAEQRQRAAEASIAHAAQGIRAGYFPPLPHEHLARADFHPAARHESWRIQRKCPATRAPNEEGDA